MLNSGETRKNKSLNYCLSQFHIVDLRFLQLNSIADQVIYEKTEWPNFSAYKKNRI